MKREYYNRVIPRDLFNEAKLFKCIGRLVLLIHDGKTINGMTFTHDGTPFVVGQYDEDGSLTIINIHFKVKRQKLQFKTTYNSKNNYPLYLYYDYVDYQVFDESGEYTEEFTNFINSL
jgi:hypothetical protein